MEHLALALIAALILAFGLISARVETSVITGPMVFALFGFVVGPAGLALLPFDFAGDDVYGLGEVTHLLAGLTLVLILFIDASRIELGLLKRHHDVPLRLLIVGMPLTIIAGAAVGAVLFDILSFWEAAVLAAILAPTDAALGQAVVSNTLVPVRIRQALNVESGLNDGIALPVILILLTVADAAQGPTAVSYWVEFVALQLILGPLVGVAIGYAGGKLVTLGSNSGWMNHAFYQLSVIGLALAAFGGAELVGGNGFIAAFAAGLTLGNAMRGHCQPLWEFGEAEAQFMTLLVFLIFGAFMIPLAMAAWDWPVLIYAALSLTVIRMLPVAISLVGTRLRGASVAFLGWFGPRGIASILFTLLVLGESALPGRDIIFSIVVATALLSIFAHGSTAFPGSRWYGTRCKMLGADVDVPENKAVPEMPLRHG